MKLLRKVKAEVPSTLPENLILIPFSAYKLQTEHSQRSNLVLQIRCARCRGVGLCVSVNALSFLTESRNNQILYLQSGKNLSLMLPEHVKVQNVM